MAHQDKVRQVPVEDEIHDRLGRFGVGDVLGDILPVAGYRWGESGVAESLQVFDNRAPRRAVVTSAVHQDEGVRTGHPGFLRAVRSSMRRYASIAPSSPINSSSGIEYCLISMPRGPARQQQPYEITCRRGDPVGQTTTGAEVGGGRVDPGGRHDRVQVGEQRPHRHADRSALVFYHLMRVPTEVQIATAQRTLSSSSEG